MKGSCYYFIALVSWVATSKYMCCVCIGKRGNRRGPSRVEAQGKSVSLFGQVIAYIKRRERKEERAESSELCRCRRR